MIFRPDAVQPIDLETDANGERARGERRQRAVKIATAVAEAKSKLVVGNQRNKQYRWRIDKYRSILQRLPAEALELLPTKLAAPEDVVAAWMDSMARRWAPSGATTSLKARVISCCG